MKIIYLAHKFNLEQWRVQEIKSVINKLYHSNKNITIINTPILFGWANISEQQAMRMALKLLSASDELWIFLFHPSDLHSSKGLYREIRLASKLQKPIRILTPNNLIPPD